MVESNDAKGSVFTLSENERKIMLKHLGEGSVVNQDYKQVVALSKVENDKRHEIASDIEYDFQLALQKGDYYLGNAVINFYVNRLPQHGELFLNCNALAISHLTVNDKQIDAAAVFHGQRIGLEQPHIELGWNTV